MHYFFCIIESALRERKKRRPKSKQASSVQEASRHSDVTPSVSIGKSEEAARETRLCTQNVGIFYFPILFCLSLFPLLSLYSLLFFILAKEVPMSSGGILLQIDTPTVTKKRYNNGQRITPLVFYGSPHGVPPKRPVRLLRLLHEIHLDLTEQNRLRYQVHSCNPTPCLFLHVMILY